MTERKSHSNLSLKKVMQPVGWNEKHGARRWEEQSAATRSQHRVGESNGRCHERHQLKEAKMKREG